MMPRFVRRLAPVVGPAERAQVASYATLAPAAIGQLIAGMEGLWTLGDHRRDGVLRGRAVDGARSRTGLVAARALDSTAGAVAIHLGSIVGSGLILAGRRDRRMQAAGVMIVLASNKMFERRNPYGRDGSDQMSGVILSYRLATWTIPDREQSDRLFLEAVNLQTAVSYTASGASKLISQSWLSGNAVAKILMTDAYGGTLPSRVVADHPTLGRIASWLTVTWEVSFPAVYLLPPRGARTVLHLVKGFHIAVAAAMGLPRFFWGFSSAHSAVQFTLEESAR